jgi:hypothetical protein
MVGKDGAVLAVEKIVTSKLYEPGVNKRVFIIDTHVGMVNKRINLTFLLIHNDIIVTCFRLLLVY